MYNKVSDTRNTGKGMTPNKAIKRPNNPPVKPIIGKRLGKRGG